jgi:hypothetical protein
VSCQCNASISQNLSGVANGNDFVHASVSQTCDPVGIANESCGTCIAYAETRRLLEYLWGDEAD